jgi:membrane protein implicated in regulation of membrane protease activity
MMTFNPIKAFNSFVLDEQTEQAVANFLRNADLSYRGRAIVSDTIAPDKRGRVHFQGSWWPAQCEQGITLAVGEVVQVMGRKNITLLVRPAQASVVPC